MAEREWWEMLELTDEQRAEVKAGIDAAANTLPRPCPRCGWKPDDD